MLEISRGIVASSPDCDSEAIVREANEVAIALIAKIISADNKLNTSESEFLNAVLSLKNSPTENLEVLRVLSEKWDKLLTNIPEFLEMAVRSDKNSNAKDSATLVDCLKTIGN